MKINLKILSVAVLAFLSVVSAANAAWTGPIVIVNATFGSDDGKVGYVSDEYSGEFPRSFGVSPSGKIAIADLVNERLKVFASDGQFLHSIPSPFEWAGWPGDVLVGGECAIVNYVQFTQTFDLSTGTLIGNVPNMGGADLVSDDCSKVYVWTKMNGKDIWRTYTPTGTVISEVTEKPLELGRVVQRSMGNGQYISRVIYPDKSWHFSGIASPENFRRDLAGNLFANLGNLAERIDDQGAIVASIYTPETVKVEIPSGSPGIENSYDYPEMYGDAYIAPNGDVYCWKKTSTTYSILKWTWTESAPEDKKKAANH